MTTTTEDQVTQVATPSPLRFAPESAFATLREFFRDVAFEEDEICRRLDIESLDRFRAIRDGRPDAAPADAVDVLIRLFLDNEPMAWSEMRALLPATVVDGMLALGLVRDHRADAARAVANVLLYPTESLYIASDVATLPDGDAAQWWDIVYAAITTNTRTFLERMPRGRCSTFLDLCSGTGVAALVAASTFAEHAWAIDVAERSTDFARFNAKLNGISNVTMLTGDLYEPVAGTTFDRIVAHPPYVPARENRMVYRDAGSDGEQVTRRIIAGLPEYLRAGGYFHCACRATDRKGAPLEQRLRTMLGEQANEFDVAVVVADELDPTEYYVRMAIAGRGTWADAEEWHHHFAKLGVTRMVYGTIAIHRHARPHAPFTIRRRVGSGCAATDIERLLLAAETAASQAAFDRTLDARPRLAPGVSLESNHVTEDGGWAMRSCVLATSGPFDVRLPCPPGMVSLVGGLDGLRTVRELYASAADGNALSDEATLDRFAAFLHMLAAHGVVTLHESSTS